MKYHSPLPGTLTPGLLFSLLDAFLHFKNFIKALLQCGKCQREMHWRQIGISLIVKLLLLTDVLLCLLKSGEWNARLSGRTSSLCHLLKVRDLLKMKRKVWRSGEHLLIWTQPWWSPSLCLKAVKNLLLTLTWNRRYRQIRRNSVHSDDNRRSLLI